MKYLVIVQFTFIVCFSTMISAVEFEPPGPETVQKKFHISAAEFLLKCEDRGVLKKILDQHYSAILMAYSLANNLVEEREKKLLKVDDNVWNDLIANHCLENADLKTLGKDNTAGINECFDEEIQLKEKEITDFTTALCEEYCAAVKKLAEEKYEKTKN